MSEQIKFQLSDNFMNLILNNYFGIPDQTYSNTSIYVGLGIEFDEETFSFTKEPVSKWFTINQTPCQFHDPVDGIIRNSNSIEWDTATTDWTKDDETIKYLGIYYKREVNNFSSNPIIKYDLIGVLPLLPAESIKTGEKMVLNPNSIQIKLSNR